MACHSPWLCSASQSIAPNFEREVSPPPSFPPQPARQTRRKVLVVFPRHTYCKGPVYRDNKNWDILYSGYLSITYHVDLLAPSRPHVFFNAHVMMVRVLQERIPASYIFFKCPLGIFILADHVPVSKTSGSFIPSRIRHASVSRTWRRSLPVSKRLAINSPKASRQ